MIGQARLRIFALATLPLVIAAWVAAITTLSAVAQAQVVVAVAPQSYADVADFAVESATIIDAQIRKVREVEPARAVGVPPHLVRLYIEAEVQTVIYGRDPVAARIAYITDQPRLANGRAPRLKRQRVLLFARPVAITNQVQLVVPSAQMAWDQQRDSIARTIAAELSRGNVPPEVTGISQAFHVPGTIPGESETQVFLRTANGQPVSLTILRRPGQQPRWAAAFGEIVDESAVIPALRTLPRYRLACGLPMTIPHGAVSGLSERDMAAAVIDYQFARTAIGACDRTPAAVAVPPQLR